MQIVSDAEINANKLVTFINKSYYYSNIPGYYKVILSKGKYLINGAGGKFGDNLIEIIDSPTPSYISVSGSKVFNADIDSISHITYTAISDIEIDIRVGNGEVGCDTASAGGNCSHGSIFNADDGYVKITIIE